MIVTTTFDVAGHEISEYLGIVRGIVVRAPTISQGFIGGLNTIIGGKIGAFTQMCETARQQAYDEMIQHAEQLGANAIVGMRYDTGEVGAQTRSTEVLCYGTAVVLQRTR